MPSTYITQTTSRNKRPHVSRYIVNLIATSKDEKRYRAPMLVGTIAGLIQTDLPPSIAAEATTMLYNMELDTLTARTDIEGFQSDSDRYCTYIKGGKHRLMSKPIGSILDVLDTPQKVSTPIVHWTKAISKDQGIMNIEMSLDIYDPSTTVTVSLHGDHKHLGFIFHSNLRTPTIQKCEHGTPASNIKRWRSRFQNTAIRAIDGKIIGTIAQLNQRVK